MGFLKELQQVVVEASQQFKPLPEFSKLSKNLSKLYMKSDVRLRDGFILVNMPIIKFQKVKI